MSIDAEISRLKESYDNLTVIRNNLQLPEATEEIKSIEAARETITETIICLRKIENENSNGISD